MHNKEIRVLLIGENSGDARLIKEILAKSSPQLFSLTHSSTLSEGTGSWDDNKYDVILLDVDISGGNPLDFIGKTRKTSQDIPIVVLTGPDDEKTAISALQFGAQDYLVKGQIDGNLLVRTLKYAIERRLIQEELRKHRGFLMELVEERTAELQKSNEALALEIFERKRKDRLIKTTNSLLKLFPSKYSRKDYLESVVEIISDWSNCRCVGIRVLNEKGDIPYESYTGFDHDFWRSENNLSIRKDQCVCMRVIAGQPKAQDITSMTRSGSWLCNDTSSYFQELSDMERVKFRGVCVKSGFASVAVVPIRFFGRTFAAIHLADERNNMVPAETIEALETMTPLIGEAVHRFNVEDELMNNYESLQESNELLERVFSNVHIMIAYMDTDFNFIRVNRKYAEADGREPDFFIGKNHFDLYPNKENEDIFRKVSDSGMPYVVKAKPFVYKGKPERGTTFWDWSLIPVKNAEGTVGGLVLILIDVTENITLYSELMRTEHLASIGKLAAGVAHEVNNPINGIINYAQILLNRCEAGSKEHDIANRIIKESDRIAGIVKSLLSFSRVNKDEKVSVNISEILSDSLALTSSQIKKGNIKLDMHIPPDLPKTFAQPQHIKQVFLNLISNACYALTKRYPEENQDKILKIFAETVIINDMPFVRITFHDNGTGIPEKIKNRIMDPFFTTKSESEGTGLGLSISHGIISDHGGKIKIESTEGKFTKIMIDLPLQGQMPDKI